MPKNQANICAVITETSVETARQAIQKATVEADIIEVRLDYLRDFDFSRIDHLGVLLDQNILPVIITCRASDEGGQQHIDNSIRLPLLVEGAKRFANYCDIEAAHYHEATKLSPDLAKQSVKKMLFKKMNRSLILSILFADNLETTNL